LFAVRWVKIDRGSSRQRVDVIRFDAGDLVLDESHPPPKPPQRERVRNGITQNTLAIK
jgi:hypothetical protein